VDAIAIDLDGTLLHADKLFSDRSRATVDDAMAAGIAVIVATSRPVRTVRHFIGTELLDRVSVVQMNGASAIGRGPLTGEHLFHLPDGAADEISSRAGMIDGVRSFIESDGYKFGCVPDVTVDEAMIISGLDRNNLETVAALARELTDASELFSSGATKVVISAGHAPLTPLIEEIRETYGDKLAYFPSDSDMFLNVVHPDVSKWSSIARLTEPAGIPTANVVAFGDDDPDRIMLEGAGVGIAMSNATDYVMEAADLVTSSNDEDGVAIVIEQILASR
jgi:HAD superfamily hydrolase (TIGR01484 family)